MRDFGNGWSGLRDYAKKCGVANADDVDDVVAAKVKAVIQGTLPERELENDGTSENNQSPFELFGNGDRELFGDQ
jgi:hypothetical protein